LIVAGDALDGYRDEVRKMAGEYGIGARTTFTGPLSGPLKSCALAHSELFVLPSLSESFGIAIAEALAHGVAVITTRGAPWPELEERRCGWWIDHGSGPLRAALAQALEQSPDELREMGERGRELVLERYCWRELGGQMKSAYEWLAGSAQAPGCIRKFSASAPMGATAQGP
jgi:glycosyltransferase involved in cell wall biosynthesis